MKKHYPVLGSTIVMLVLLVFGSKAYADDPGQFNHFVQSLHADRAQKELQLGLDSQWSRVPRATSYYDDMVDHYEKDQIMSDQISQGIR